MVDDDRLKELSSPKRVDALTVSQRDWLKKNYHTCPSCGKPKAGGRCKVCTNNVAKRKDLASLSRQTFFQLSDMPRAPMGSRIT